MPKPRHLIGFSYSVACPRCGATRSKTVDSRPDKGEYRRRRECVQGHRFTTRERAER